jgi:hypothetical protein
LFEFRRFAGHFHERAGRLFARERRGGFLDSERRFNQILCKKSFHARVGSVCGFLVAHPTPMSHLKSAESPSKNAASRCVVARHRQTA